MAYNRKIHTTPLFKSKVTGATGTAGTSLSDPVDLRDISAVGNFSMSYSIASTAATAGSTVFEYLGCPVYDGTYVAAGTFGTFGGIASGIISFSPVTIPFMKIRAVSGTSAVALITAELNVR